MDLLAELGRINYLHAYVTTGDVRYLKKAEEMEPKDVPCRATADLREYDRQQDIPDEFDIYDDQQMRDCIGGRLTKPVQALLQADLGVISKEAIEQMVAELRDAVQREWEAL